MKLSLKLLFMAINSLTLGVLLISLPASCASADEAARSSAPTDLPNFHQVHPYLYRGGQPSSAGLKKLKDMGIKTIIDLRGSEAQVKSEANQVRKLGMQSINLPMGKSAPSKSQVHKFLSTVEKAESRGDKAPVFVHCAHGSDRTGCMIGIWRVSRDGYSYDQAYQEMRKYYFGPGSQIYRQP